MRRRGEGAVVAAALIVGLAAAAPASAAERFYGVTAANRLVTFNSDSPGAIRSSRAITGLGRADVRAIDIRPANGELYGLASNDRLYRINPRTGRAAAIGPAPFGQRSEAIGFDFNPTVDKIRLVNAAGQNARVDPDTGALVDGDADLTGAQLDQPLRYDANDGGFQTPPRIGGAAYTNSKAGAASTDLFAIDERRNSLVLQAPPNDGVLRTVGRLGVDAEAPVGFDIASNGGAYAAFRATGIPGIGLFRIDLSTGRVKPARFDTIGFFSARRHDPLQALAAAGRVRADRTRPRVRNRKLNAPLISQLLRGRALRLAVTCNEACGVRATFRLGNRRVGTATGVVRGRGGSVVLRLKLSRNGKRVVRRLRPNVLRVGLRATDAAGNTVSTER